MRERFELEDAGVKTDDFTELLNELGIESSDEDVYKLILWNDHINDMLTVIVALYNICKLSNEECIRVMLEAHEKGKAVAKTGYKEELTEMKEKLNNLNLEVTIEL